MTVRGELLDDAKAAVDGDRNESYGDPTDNFKDTADLWMTYLYGKFDKDGGVKLEASDVAAMMILLKIARLCHTSKRDTWQDIAGYAGCGWECAV